MKNAMRSRLRNYLLITSIFIIIISGITYSCNLKSGNDELSSTNDFKTISFQSEDSLEITADLYLAHDKNAPFIILFHQAWWSRGEYREIAPKLNKMGFNCMAIDQRSGKEVNNVKNQTFERAEKAKMKTTYIDAYPDLVAAIKYAKSNYVTGKLIVWGSSYSASLVIKLASEYSEMIDGVLCFAPGEYFAKLGKSETFIAEAAKKVTCPIFITSAKNEKPGWKSIFESTPSKSKHSFLPETDGNHGSRALWEQFEDSKNYWAAVTEFLEKYFL